MQTLLLAGDLQDFRGPERFRLAQRITRVARLENALYPELDPELLRAVSRGGTDRAIPRNASATCARRCCARSPARARRADGSGHAAASTERNPLFPEQMIQRRLR